MSGRGRLALAAALCALAIAGCGDSDSPSEESGAATAPAETVPELTQPGRQPPTQVIQSARNEVAVYCRRVAKSLGGAPPPPPRAFERVTVSLDRLAALAAQQPEATTADGSTPRLALGDIAENLEGTNCDARLVAHIDEALASLPAE